jgi:hypothetical protein
LLTSFHRKLITQNFGDFEKSFNIGSIAGGFGQADPSVPVSNVDSSSKAPTKRRASFSPTSPKATKSARSDKIQGTAEEFLNLSVSRKKLLEEIEAEQEDDEKELLKQMLDQVQKRRKQIVDLGRNAQVLTQDIAAT